jgi:hypothetical protein
MKVYIDRNHCNVEGAGCESCFASRIENYFKNEVFDELDIAGCVTHIEEESKHDEILFFIRDRDNSNKLLSVTQENWPDAYNSWMLLFEEQNKSHFQISVDK